MLSYASSLKGTLGRLRASHAKEIAALPEVVARTNIVDFLRDNSHASSGRSFDDLKNDYERRFRTGQFEQQFPSSSSGTGAGAGAAGHTMSSEQVRSCLDAAMATFHLHVESRIAALCGEGYYTIGPCGEEMLASAALALTPSDSVALHYRHLGLSMQRQLQMGRYGLDDLILDRARGHAVSRFDPVTGGVHCAIGARVDDDDDDVAVSKLNGGGDYIVTSTLASQCPPAVGRALGFSVASKLLGHRPDKSKQVSFVTLGDGSCNNAHFLSALNLARFARHQKIKCPVVFGVSDNGLSISLHNRGYLTAFLDSLSRGALGVPVFEANGNDLWDVHDKTCRAVEYARKYAAPAAIVYGGITRRFGHAATDRQWAYLSQEQIAEMGESCVVAGNMVRAVEGGAVTVDELRERFDEIRDLTERAFDVAVEEPKVDSREDMVGRVSAPMVHVPRLPTEKVQIDALGAAAADEGATGEAQAARKRGRRRGDVMRKHMTSVVRETLEDCNDVVYIGEDVEHGGYYLVTDGLASEFPRGRVCDFPPDETTLLGVAVGYSQCGLTPVVEIPYAKYLDCGFDTFAELAVANWLSDGQQPNGMVVRLQGFDRGTFGGNFHTHNTLHIPPGVDVVCYSNGEDYARGFRNAVAQARAGRVVMMVDSTHLLNLRHLYEKGDRLWERDFPSKEEEGGEEADQGGRMGFQDVIRYGGGGGGGGDGASRGDAVAGKIAVVTYGTGVISSLQARRAMFISGELPGDDEALVDVIDCPYLSDIPDGLRELLVAGRDDGGYDHVLFADVCKEGPNNPLSAIATRLHSDGTLLGKDWQLVSAPRTYNPLGNETLTFLNQEDITEGLRKCIQ